MKIDIRQERIVCQEYAAQQGQQSYYSQSYNI